MIVGSLTVDLVVVDARTLKDKRRVVQSLKQRLQNRFNVSVAEVGYNENARRCQLGLAVVSNESRAVQSQLDKIVDVIRVAKGLSLVDYETQLL